MLPLRDATPPRRTPVVTAGILLACALAFAYELVLEAQGGGVLNAFIGRHGLIPEQLVEALGSGDLASGPVADLFTHMVLHAGWLHLMGNALFLWIFGPRVEDRLGRGLFLAFYVAGGVAAAAGHVLTDPGDRLPMIGASGAISAVLGGYLVLFPRARIQSLVFLVFFYELIAVPAVIVLGFWFGLQLIDGFASLWLTAEGTGGVAFWAHIGGFVAGVAMALPVRALRRERDPVPAGDAVAAKRGGDGGPRPDGAPTATAQADPPGPPQPPAPALPPPPRAPGA